MCEFKNAFGTMLCCAENIQIRKVLSKRLNALKLDYTVF
jgi:hypothetical protein